MTISLKKITQNDTQKLQAALDVTSYIQQTTLHQGWLPPLWHKLLQLQTIPHLLCTRWSLPRHKCPQQKWTLIVHPQFTTSHNPLHRNTSSSPFFHPSKPAPSLIAEAKQKLSEFQVPCGYCKLFLASLPCCKGRCPYRHECLWCPGSHTAAQEKMSLLCLLVIMGFYMCMMKWCQLVDMCSFMWNFTRVYITKYVSKTKMFIQLCFCLLC